MINADNTDRKKLAFLFEGIQDSMVISYLQGYLGTCYVDRLLENLFDYITGTKSTAIYADHRWCDMHLKYPQNHPQEVMICL